MNSQRFDQHLRVTEKMLPGLSKLELSDELYHGALDIQLCNMPNRVPASHETVHYLGKWDSNVEAKTCIISFDTATSTGTEQEGYHECYVLPLNPPPTPLYNGNLKDRSTSELADYVSSIFAPESKMTEGVERINDHREMKAECIVETDEFERQGYTLTRTIIRPRVQPSLCGLNCCSSQEAFDEEVEAISAARAKELRGEGGIKVYVTDYKRIEVES